MPEELPVLDLPSADDRPVRRIVRSVHRCQLGRRTRLEFDSSEGISSVADAGKILIHPDDAVAGQHQVIQRIHRRIGSVAVPQLPDRGGSAAEHVAVGRIGVIGGDCAGEIHVAIFRKPAEKVLHAHQSHTDVAVPFADGLVDDVPDNSLLMPLGDKPETEGYDVGRDGVVGIA